VHGYFTEDRAFITIQGRRFRKDGLPGKREDVLYVDIPIRESRGTSESSKRAKPKIRVFS